MVQSEAAPPSQKELKHEISNHKKEYERLKKELIQNKKLEKKYLHKRDDLQFKMLELRMDKEKLHMQIEQNHMNEIRFSRRLSRLNREIREEKVSLRSHQVVAGIQEELVLKNAMTVYLARKDRTPESSVDMLGIWVSDDSLRQMQKRISRDRVREVSTSLKMKELVRKRNGILRMEVLRKREEADERYQMSRIRKQITALKERASGIEKNNELILTKTQKLLGLIHHLRLVELRNRHRYLHHFSPVNLKIRGLLWPVNGKIIETFGRYHDGVDIAAISGSPVKSAETGRILFARHYSGYGKLVIVNHGHHVYSLYGHMKTIRVREGQIVRKGQLLGTAGGGGTSGRSTIFFGLTHFGNPVNPLPYLGKRKN
jgi:murein DD-endopeptidase MepM/ murein hydrolase activator NlpD